MGPCYAYTKANPPIFLTAMQPFKNAEGENSSKVKKGAGWSLNDVKKFLGQRMYVIPCGAVDKSDEPHSRIIHNYRYLSKKSASINDASQNVCVVYHIQ